MSAPEFLRDLLVRGGLADAAAIDRGLQVQAERRVTLGRALASLGVADEEDVARRIAAALHLAYCGPETPAPSAEVVKLLPEEFCRKRGVLPIDRDAGGLRLGVVDPLDYAAQQDVEFRTGHRVSMAVVTQNWFDASLVRAYRQRPGGMRYDMLREVTPAGEVETVSSAEEEYDLPPEVLARETNLPPIVRLVNMILSEAAANGASDIHVEPREAEVQVRQRVDGLLRDVLTIPHNLQEQTISRIKIISGMDISERRRPQDGRARLKYQGRRIDLRVSTLPTQFGEKVVIRLLEVDSAILPLDRMMLSTENLQSLQRLLTCQQGMILVTGPTGSGKTTTLYSVLSFLKSPTTNIVTLEDPIEFQVPGINQMQVNLRAGVTFATGLRSILRQDPNVILVGEIRDQDTAVIALQASQTGHLVLSTLHTNDAPATVTRLFDLGVQPYLVASSLIGVIAQRLVRRVCPHCAVERAPSAATIERIGGATRLPEGARWMAGAGCDHCHGEGLKGRLPIHELLPVAGEVRDLIAGRAPEHVIRRAAQHAGMRTLLDDGVAKASKGLTTLDEVLGAVSSAEAGEDASPPKVAVAHAREPSASPTTPPPAPAGGESCEPEGGPDPSTRQRVLVVEDSPTVASVVQYFLELEGFQVSVAADGVSGLEAALKERPNLVVSDVNMPGMGGLEMVRALRADGRTAGVRVLMLTSEASVDSEAEGLAAGADDYIVKPVEPRRLAARVKTLLARSSGGAAHRAV